MKTSAGDRQEYTLEKLPSKMLNNRVLVKIEDNLDDGNKLKDTTLDIVLAGGEWNEASRVVRFGKVVMKPERLVFRDKDNGESEGLMEWDTDMEIEIGDLCYFGKIASANSEIVYVGDELYYLIPYSRLILAIRGEEIIMLNGYCLLEEVIEKTRVRGLVLDFGDHVNKKMGVVTHVGNGNRSYFGSEAVDAEIEVGDEVVFEKNFFGYLEDDTFATLPKGTGFVQRSWIVGVLN